MLQLSVLPLLCILSLTLADEPPSLFSEECCTQKTVGGVGYSQVAGDTDDFPQCKEGCVYEKDGDKGSRFCFKSGNEKVECTEPFLDSSYVFVTRNADNMIFKTDIGTFSCEIRSDTPEGDTITCSEIPDQEAEGTEKAAFFYAQSDGETEWMCLHTENEALHCDKDDKDLKCHKVSTPGEHDILFVEAGGQAEGTGLQEQLLKCGEKCANVTKNGGVCTFFTLSYDDDFDGRQARNHDDFLVGTSSECGIRNYKPRRKLKPINKNQYAGFPGKNGNPPKIFPKTVFVYDIQPNLNPTKCKKYCLNKIDDCRTWTFDMKTGLCALNVYNPFRRISIAGRSSKPGLVSGCIEDKDKDGNVPPKGWKCPPKTAK